MNVLSLFDGLSGGRVALDRAGLPITNYYASEIDKYAIAVSQANYPEIIRLGDVKDWHDWNIEMPDLIIAGSPCQGFSRAGKMLNFNDSRSALFFTFLDILNHYLDINPGLNFMLENVSMKKEYIEIISEMLGVCPIKIDSALVSGQRRTRYYWTNIGDVKQPEDKEIMLNDVLQNIDLSKFMLSEKAVNYMNREVSGGRNHWDFKHHSDTSNNKSACMVANLFKGVPYNVLIDRRADGSYVLNAPEATKKGYTEIEDGDCFDATFPNSKTRRGRNMKHKSNCLTAGTNMYMQYKHPLCRKFTPIECERLQTLPDNYTNHVSDSQRYKMIGNGWTIDVIAHIFRMLKPQSN